MKTISLDEHFQTPEIATALNPVGPAAHDDSMVLIQQPDAPASRASGRSERQYWVAVASRDHALRGVAEGMVQANHGKPGPVRRMQPGDGLLIYAPKLVFGQPAPCQCFVALGEVSEGDVFQAQVSADFQPFRRRAHYQPVPETPIQPLLEHLTFIKDKAHWGYSFRFGCFQIPAADFDVIRAALVAPASTP